MFQLIEPEDQRLHSELIVSFLENLPHNYIALNSMQNSIQSTFLLAKDETNTIKGGAQLFKTPVSDLKIKVQEYLELYHPHIEEVRSGIISMEIDEEVTGREFEKTCQLFYSALYADLIAFGVKENAPFLCLTMESVEHLTIEMQGYWPFAFEVKPSSRNRLFNGILTLMGGHQNTEGISRRANANQEANFGRQT